MATHSSILACRIPWTEEPGGLQSMGSQELDTTKHTHTTTAVLCALRCSWQITHTHTVRVYLGRGSGFSDHLAKAERSP